jgi:S1-C subfamily serine protease
MFFIDVQDVVIGGHKGIAHLAFDTNNKLDAVSLDFTRYEDETGCFRGSADDEAATRSLIKDVSDQTLDRLGAPVSQTGTFLTSRELASYFSLGKSGKADVQNPLEGKRTWKTGGELIEEWFAIPCGKLMLFVSYNPQTKDEPSAPPYASGQTALTTAQIAKKISPSVVVIQGTTDSGAVLGSGFIVSKDGKIVTNLHVVKGMKTATVRTANGEAFDSLLVLATDERRDLAIVKIAGFDLPILDLGNSDGVTVGEPVVIAGSPRGLEGTVTAGILSSVRDSGDGFKVLQTDAAVNPGNSGGPLVNNNGQVIGVVSFKLRSAEGLNFAVPISYVRGLLDSLHEPMSLGQMRASMSATSTAGQQDDGPSLNDTLDWLSQTIPLGTTTFVYSHTGVAQQLTQSINIHNIAWDLHSCTVQFGSVIVSTTLEYPTQLGPYQGTFRYTVPLGALNGWSAKRQDNLERFAKVEPVTFLRGERWGYGVFLTSNSKVISLALSAFGPNVPGTVESRDWLNITFNDESLALRVATAFHHPSDLCRKKEIF